MISLSIIRLLFFFIKKKINHLFHVNKKEQSTDHIFRVMINILALFIIESGWIQAIYFSIILCICKMSCDWCLNICVLKKEGCCFHLKIQFPYIVFSATAKKSRKLIFRYFRLVEPKQMSILYITMTSWLVKVIKWVMNL